MVPECPVCGAAITINLDNEVDKVIFETAQTKLTQAEATLLSPGEQALAQRINRRV